MSNKTRIRQLEKRKPKAQKIAVMFDALEGGRAKFDGVEMTQAEAEAKAAKFSGVVLHVIYDKGAAIQAD